MCEPGVVLEGGVAVAGEVGGSHGVVGGVAQVAEGGGGAGDAAADEVGAVRAACLEWEVVVGCVAGTRRS